MYHLNDKDLDRLSKEAAEQYDVDQNPAGWDQVGKRLETELPVSEDKDRRRWLFFLLLLVCLSGGGMVWMLNKTPEKNSSQAVSTDSKINAVSDKSITAKENADNTKPEQSTGAEDSESAQEKTDVATTDNKNSEKNPDRSNEKSAVLPNEKSSVEKQQPAENISSQSKSADLLSATKKASNNKGIAGRTGKGLKKTGSTSTQLFSSGNGLRDRNKSNSEKSKENGLAVNDKTVADKPATEEQKKTEESTPTVVDNSKTDPAATVNSVSADSTATTDSPDNNKQNIQPIDSAKNEPLTKNNKKSPKKGSSSKGLEIGAVFAPDLNNVKFNTASKWGYNVGLQIAYRFSDRLSVNTGLIYTKKNYSSRGEDFTPPKHYWTYYVDLMKVEGDCSMLEIPLNLRYDIFSSPKRKFFVSSGLSSYLMTDEYYDYHYKRNGVYSVSPYPVANNSNYWFSILNISAGFEKSIGRKFSIQAEPYLKMPLKGIGFGKINLNSYGIYFGVKYRPFARN